MARQLENRFFLYGNYTKPEYMLSDMKDYIEYWQRKYKGRNITIKRHRNKQGVRVIVEERQIEKGGEER